MNNIYPNLDALTNTAKTIYIGIDGSNTALLPKNYRDALGGNVNWEKIKSDAANANRESDILRKDIKLLSKVKAAMVRFNKILKDNVLGGVIYKINSAKATLKQLANKHLALRNKITARSNNIKDRLASIENTLSEIKREDLTVLEKVKTVFREQGISIGAVLSALAIIVGISVTPALIASEADEDQDFQDGVVEPDTPLDDEGNLVDIEDEDFFEDDNVLEGDENINTDEIDNIIDASDGSLLDDAGLVVRKNMYGVFSTIGSYLISKGDMILTAIPGLVGAILGGILKILGKGAIAIANNIWMGLLLIFGGVGILYSKD